MKKEFWVYKVLDHYYLYNKNTYSRKEILSEQLDTFDALIIHPNNILPGTFMDMKDREIRSLTLIIDKEKKI